MSEDGRKGAHAPDVVAIDRKVQSAKRALEFNERAQERDPLLEDAIQFMHDIAAMAEVSKDPAFRLLKLRALLSLRRRFSRHIAWRVLRMARSKANEDFRVIVRARLPSERLDGGRPAKQQLREDEDLKLLLVSHALRNAGLTAPEARAEAAKEVGLSLEPETIKARIGEARKRAGERGFLDRYAPYKIVYLGDTAEPVVKVTDLPARGRPKKG